LKSRLRSGFKGDSGAIRTSAGLRSARGSVRPYGELCDRRELSSELKIKPFLLSLVLVAAGLETNESLANQHQPINLRKGSALADGKEGDGWLGEDKLKHLMVSVFLTGIGYRLCADGLDWPAKRSRAIASSFTFSLGLGKELRDRTQGGESFSLKDLGVDLLGIGIGLLIFTTW